MARGLLPLRRVLFLLMNLGYVKYTVAAEVIKDKTPRRVFDRLILAGRRFVGPVFCNALLFAGAMLVGAPWLYGLWVIAYLKGIDRHQQLKWLVLWLRFRILCYVRP